jgi:hypothetical protein
MEEYINLNGVDVKELIAGKGAGDILNLKVLQGLGFGIDAGAIYHLPGNLNFGAQISDVWTRINYDSVLYKEGANKNIPDDQLTETAEIPAQANIGAAWTPNFLKNRITLAADIRDLSGVYETDFEDKLRLGAELRFSPFAFRAGLAYKKPTFGIGFELGSFQIIYAYYYDRSLTFPDNKLLFHEISLGFKFGHFKGKPFGETLNKIESAAKNAKADKQDNQTHYEQTHVQDEYGWQSLQQNLNVDTENANNQIYNGTKDKAAKSPVENSKDNLQNIRQETADYEYSQTTKQNSDKNFHPDISGYYISDIEQNLTYNKEDNKLQIGTQDNYSGDIF